MNRILSFAVGLLLPVAVFAEVNIDVHISNNHQINKEPENYNRNDYDFIDEGEPWFEDAPAQGPMRISFEYQWTLLGPSHILRYREVRFNPWAESWVFGPWMTKEHFCHPSCRMHHEHAFYHPKVASVFWHRQFRNQNGRTVCYYEYEQPSPHRRGNPKIYRHEYQPLSKHEEKHDRYEPYNNHFRNEHRDDHVVRSVEKVEVRPDGVYKTKKVEEKASDGEHNNNGRYHQNKHH